MYARSDDLPLRLFYFFFFLFFITFRIFALFSHFIRVFRGVDVWHPLSALAIERSTEIDGRGIRMVALKRENSIWHFWQYLEADSLA